VHREQEAHAVTVKKAFLNYAQRATAGLRRFRGIAIIGASVLLILVGVGVIIRQTARPVGVASPLPTPTQSPKPALPFHWAAIAGPHPGTGDDELSGTAAVNANDAWTVGFYHHQSDSMFFQTLIEHWNGIAWSVVPSPNPGAGSNLLSSVAAVDANDVWAVGEYQNSASGADTTLIEHWNGKAWSVTPSPNPGASIKFLFGVTAVDASHVWAAGIYQESASGALRTLIEQWDGSVWSVVPCPNPGTGNNELYGIAAVNANDVWAVGHYQNGASGVAQTLIEHWDGGVWTVMPSPNQGSSNNVLAGITATDANDAWAVGYYQDDTSGTSQTAIERWNGSVWSVESTPNPGYGDNELFSVTAIDPENVWAVGNYQDGPEGPHTLTERWNGSAWSVEPTPNPGSSGNSLDGIAAVDAQHVWAVGEYHVGIPSQLLILQGSA
jgi:hypothetical protein